MKQRDVQKLDCTVKEAWESDLPFTLPCSDKDMIYDAFDKEYRLTPECLTENGIDASRYIIEGDVSHEKFIKKVSEDWYQMIMDKAFTNFELYKFMQATGWGFKNLTPIQSREKIKEALIAQAKYKSVNGDPRDYAGVDFGNNQNNDIKDTRYQFRHMSQISQNIAKGMGLFYNGEIDGYKFHQFRQNLNLY